MRVFRAYEAKDEQDAAFRLYMGTGIQIIAENTASLAGAGKTLRPYAEFFDIVPADDRTGDEIAADIIKRHNLKVKQ